MLGIVSYTIRDVLDAGHYYDNISGANIINLVLEITEKNPTIEKLRGGPTSSSKTF